MYNGYKKIHATYLEPNEVSDCVIEESIGWSHNSYPPLKQQLQKNWEAAIAEALEPIAAFDPTIRVAGDRIIRPEKNFYNGKEWLKEEAINQCVEIPFDELSAAQAVRHQNGQLGVDFRPHLYDNVLKSHILCDSGSQICAWPPDPGDKPIAGAHLRAVNGSVLKCYGYKQITSRVAICQ